MRVRFFNTARWLLIRSFVFTLLFTLLMGLIPFSIPRNEFGPAPTARADQILRLGYSSSILFTDDEGGENYYVRTHGIPWFFFIADHEVKQPTASVLLCRFALDWAFWWAFWFCALVVPLILLECIRLTAFFAARGIHALRSDRNK